MHHEKLVVSVRSLKTNKFYKEKGGTVYIPFGDEYTIYIKNLNTVDAVVRFAIDGNDPMAGDEFIVRANSTFELKGDKANKAFKFIKKTEKISNHRGDRIDDGMVRVEFQFEEPLPVTQTITTVHNDYYTNWSYPHWGWPYRPYRVRHTFFDDSVTHLYHSNSSGGAGGGGDALRGKSAKLGSATSFTSSMGGAVNCSYNASSQSFSGPTMDSCDIPVSGGIVADDPGITVQGRAVDQSFVPATTRKLEDAKHVIILNLAGVNVTGSEVKKEQHSRKRITCPTCGTRGRGSFCAECGTALV